LARYYLVTKMVFLSKGNGESLAGTIAKVCQDSKENCKRFGWINKVKKDECFVLEGTAIAGNMIRLHNDDTGIVLCEMKAWGTPTTAPTTTTTAPSTTPPPVCGPEFADTDGQLELASCTSASVKTQGYSAACTNIFDGSLSRDVKEGTCFLTKSSKKGWVEIKLARYYLVTKMVFLSKGNGESLAGTIAKVCQDSKENCKRFGWINKVKKDECFVLEGTAIAGNMIRLHNDDTGIVLCEMKAWGTPTDAPTTITTTTTTTAPTTSATLPVCGEFDRVDHLNIASCESIKVKDSSRACDKMFDNSLNQDVKSGHCFLSQSSRQGWVEVSLAKTSTIAQVTILAKGSGTELPGATVEICQDDNCTFFKEIEEFDKKYCTHVRGPVLKGNKVRVSITGTALAICEMRVYSSTS